MQAGKSIKFLFVLCGLVLTMSASSVCAQIIDLNKKPMMDFARAAKEKVDRKEVDLTAAFTVELSGETNESGKLDNKKSRFVKAQGNPAIVELAKMGVAAVNDTGILAYLNDLGLKTLQMTVSQDQKSFSLIVKSLAATENTAKTDASSLNLMLGLGKNLIKSKNSQTDTSSLILLNGTRIASNGKEIVISVAIPAGEFQQLITRELDKMDKTLGND